MNIKKLFAFCLVVVAVFTLSACKTTPKAAFMQFKLSDGDVQKEYYSEVTLKVVPDYEKRTLSVDFNRIFPNRTQATKDPDVKIEGATIGGENFENFEKGVTMVMDNALKDQKLDAAKSVFEVNVQDAEDKNYLLKVNWDEADVSFEGLRNFYLDVSELMTQNEQV